MSYGNKRDYHKIDLWLKRPDGTCEYLCSTTWARTCREAKAHYLDSNPAKVGLDVRANFALK